MVSHLAPSLLLAPAFLLLTIATHAMPPAERRVFGHAAVAFATVYTTLVSTVYFAQLTWVMPRLSAGRTQGLHPFLFEPFDSFLYAVDILGYSFMTLATVMAAWSLPDAPVTRTARRVLLANGPVLPFLVFQMYVHELIWIAHSGRSRFRARPGRSRGHSAAWLTARLASWQVLALGRLTQVSRKAAKAAKSIISSFAFLAFLRETTLRAGMTTMLFMLLC